MHAVGGQCEYLRFSYFVCIYTYIALDVIIDNVPCDGANVSIGNVLTD